MKKVDQLWMFTARGVLLAACAAACDDPRARVESESFDAPSGEDIGDLGPSNDQRVGPADAAPVGSDVSMSDALNVDADPADASDGSAADLASPDACSACPANDAALPVPITPEATCDGLDEDNDGQIDEGISNLCGGCGGLPPEGCQSWRIDLTQVQGEEADLLNSNRLIGLQGSTTGYSQRDIAGARCEFQRVPVPHPDAHLGIVDLVAPAMSLMQVPAFDERGGSFTYTDSPELGALHLFDPGEVVQIRSGGGRAVGPFEANITGPSRLEGVLPEALSPLIEGARGTRNEAAALQWDPAPSVADGDALRLFVGGSISLFRRGPYLAVRHYQLDARLADDGELRVPNAVFAGGVPESSIWVHLRRERFQRWPLGPHSVEVVAGHRVGQRLGGLLSLDVESPFDIVEPSPDVRHVNPGQPLRVSWTPLPPGVGPLVISLYLYDAALLDGRFLACEVTDPSTGTLELPGEVTEGWPMGEADDRQLSLRWDLAREHLEPPDVGAMSHSVTVILRLDP